MEVYSYVSIIDVIWIIITMVVIEILLKLLKIINILYTQFLNNFFLYNWVFNTILKGVWNIFSFPIELIFIRETYDKYEGKLS